MTGVVAAIVIATTGATVAVLIVRAAEREEERQRFAEMARHFTRFAEGLRAVANAMRQLTPHMEAVGRALRDAFASFGREVKS